MTEDELALRVDLSLQLGVKVLHVAVDKPRWKMPLLRVVLAHDTTRHQMHNTPSTVTYDGWEWVHSGMNAVDANRQLYFKRMCPLPAEAP